MSHLEFVGDTDRENYTKVIMQKRMFIDISINNKDNRENEENDLDKWKERQLAERERIRRMDCTPEPPQRPPKKADLGRRMLQPRTNLFSPKPFTGITGLKSKLKPAVPPKPILDSNTKTYLNCRRVSDSRLPSLSTTNTLANKLTGNNSLNTASFRHKSESNLDQVTALDEVSEMGNLTDFSQASGPNNYRGGVDRSERARLVRVDSQMSDYSTCNFSTVNANSSNSGALPPSAGALPPSAGALPPPAGALPPPAGALPPPAGALPPPAGALPPPAGALPPPAGALPPPAGTLPPPAGTQGADLQNTNNNHPTASNNNHPKDHTSNCQNLKSDPYSLPSRPPFLRSQTENSKLSLTDREREEQLEKARKEKLGLVTRINSKLVILREERDALKSDIIANQQTTEELINRLQDLARIRDIDRIRRHVDEVGTVTSLILCLTSRLAKIEAEYRISTQLNKEELMKKEDKLQQQLEEAKQLQELSTSRRTTLKSIIAGHLDEAEGDNFEQLMEEKSRLILILKEVEDKIKLGEDQVQALDQL